MVLIKGRKDPRRKSGKHQKIPLLQTGAHKDQFIRASISLNGADDAMRLKWGHILSQIRVQVAGHLIRKDHTDGGNAAHAISPLDPRLR